MSKYVFSISMIKEENDYIYIYTNTPGVVWYNKLLKIGILISNLSVIKTE